MNTKTLLPILMIALIGVLASCGGNDTEKTTQATTTDNPAAGDQPSSYDPKRGEGKFDETNVIVATLDASLAEKGKGVANTKCISCHKLSDEKLVGPGWKGVTSRHTPYWIMNFITNPDPMIDKDPKVQAQLELCLVRMPNQNLSDEEARSVLEFMRQNDGVN